MAKVRFNKSFNVNRVVKALVRTILALYVGGTIITAFGTAMNNTTSAFYSGLSLIGWTVNTSGTITNTSSTSSVLSVIGIIAIAQIVTEFISW